MRLECPHCTSTVVLDFDNDVRTDGGHGRTDDGLWGLARCCADCGHQFDIYVY